MRALSVVYAIARADFLERLRRYSYLITLLFAIFLAYAAGTGRISLRLGDYRGAYTSAWIGTMVSLVATTFVSLVGFYIVKSAVDRDRRTGVGEILAATPLAKLAYLLGKFFSNFAVLVSMLAVLSIASLTIQLVAAEDRSFDLWALLSPFLLLALPAVATTAAMALGFETLGFLRGGFGNVLWFFLWVCGIALPAVTGFPQLDPSGLWLVYASMTPAARAGIPGYTDSFSLTVADKPVRVAASFHWNGVQWTAEVVLLRLAWLAGAFALVFCGAWFFDRFDPARSHRRPTAKPSREGIARQAEPAVQPVAARQPALIFASLTPLPPDARHSGIWRLVVAELRLALKGCRWWWYAVAGGLLVAQFAAPLGVSRGPLLAVAWIWPIFVWSALGAREARYSTTPLLFSCPRLMRRQFPAAYFAGLLIAAFTGLGSAARLARAGEGHALVAWVAGVIFIPSMALALGAIGGTSKFFEGMYTALWYVGPLNRVPGFDFTGSANGPLAFRLALIYMGLASFLVAAAFVWRARQVCGT